MHVTKEHSTHIMQELMIAMSHSHSIRFQRPADNISQRHVGERIKEIRERQGLTLEYMVGKTGISNHDLAYIERNGVPRNSTVVFRKILTALGVSDEDSREVISRYYSIPNDVGLTLRIAREDAGLTRSEVSMSIGVSEGRIGRIELGTLEGLPSSPIASDVKSLVEALRVSSEDVTLLLEAIR